MYDQAEYFANAANTFSPMASVSMPNMPYAFSGVPMLGDNPLLGMAMQMVMSNFMGASGMAPMGFHGQNVYDTMKNQAFWQRQWAFQQKSAGEDKANMMRIQRGLATAFGIPWGGEQIANAEAVANMVGNASPFLAMMAPQFLDQLHGFRGSQYAFRTQVGMVTQRQINPFTGFHGGMGWPKDQDAYFDRMWDNLYGPNATLTSTRGIPAGEMGQLYTQLYSRGLMPGYLDAGDLMKQYARTATPPELATLRDAAKTAGFDLPQDKNGNLDLGQLTSKQISDLMKNDNVSKSVQGFNADKVTEKLKGYLDMVNTMRDIFGDMGRPNAPMPELLNAIEMLTNGSMSKIDPTTLNQLVRTTQALASNAGLSMQQVTMLQQDASARGAAYGIEPIFGATATQAGIAHFDAYINAHLGSTQRWGQKTPEQMMQMDIGMRQGAANSRSFYRASMASYLKDTYGQFAEGTTAKAYVAALERAAETGETTFFDPEIGKNRSLMMTQQEFVKTFSGAQLERGGQLNFGVGDYNRLMMERHTLSEYGFKHNYQQMVRDQQLTLDVKPRTRNMLRAVMPQLLKKFSNKTIDELRDIAGAIGGDFTEQMSAVVGTDDFNKDKSAGTGKVLQQLLANKGITLSDEDARALGGEVLGGLEDRTRRSGVYGPGVGFMDVMQNNNPKVREQRRRSILEAQAEGRMRDALAPLNRSEPLRRVMDYLQNLDVSPTGGKNAMVGVIASYLGGINTKDVEEKLMPELNKLHDQMGEVSELNKQISAEMDPNKRKELLEKRDDKLKSINTLGDAIAKNMEPLLPKQTAVTKDEAWEAKRSIVSRKQIDERLKAAGVSSPSDFDSFWGTTAGDSLKRKLHYQYTASQDAAKRFLADKDAMKKAGVEGREAAEGIISETGKLQGLADKYARKKGDVEMLEAGDLDPNLSKEEREKVLEQVETIKGKVSAGMDVIDKYSTNGTGGLAAGRTKPLDVNVNMSEINGTLTLIGLDKVKLEATAKADGAAGIPHEANA